MTFVAKVGKDIFCWHASGQSCQIGSAIIKSQLKSRILRVEHPLFNTLKASSAPNVAEADVIQI